MIDPLIYVINTKKLKYWNCSVHCNIENSNLVTDFVQIKHRMCEAAFVTPTKSLKWDIRKQIWQECSEKEALHILHTFDYFEL